MKCAIYCRLSEEDRNKQYKSDDSESIQNQKSILIKYALAQNWEIYNIYSDDNYAGADRNRPEFKRLLKDAENKVFDIILCKTQSRFTRELELVEKYIHGLFPIWGIRFISIVDNADTENKGNKKARQINGLVNEWYLEELSENIKAVFTNKRKEGYHIGSFALYGYKKDPQKKGHLIIDEEVAPIVREVFNLYIEGYGKTAIARMLNDRGIPNPTEYKRLQGLRYKPPKNSTLWHYYNISDMLTNEMYIGNMVQGKYGSVSYKTKQNKPRPREQWYIVEGTHEPIIDRKTWDKAQILVAKKSKPFIVGKLGLFANKTKCMYCGYTMRSCKTRGNHYLKCPSRHLTTTGCIGSFISYKNLEDIIISELNNLAKEFLNVNELEKGITLKNNNSLVKSNLANEISALSKKLDDYNKSILNLYVDKTREIISENDFIYLSSNLSKERDTTISLIDDLKDRMDKINKKIEYENDKKDIILKYMNIETLDRETLDTLIDYILIGKRKKGEKLPPVEIYWNF